MKRIISLIFALFLTSLFFAPISSKTAKITYASDQSDLQSILLDFARQDGQEARLDRRAGSVGERNTAEYLVSAMSSLAPTFFAYNATGIQEFTYNFDGEAYSSQNVIFTKSGLSEQKIVIGTSYDNYYGYVLPSGEEIKCSGISYFVSGILATLEIAHQLSSFSNLPYTIEIVFFGASTHNLAGANYYTLGIDSKSSNNFLLMANIENLGTLKPLNIYSGEKSSNGFDKFIVSHMNKCAGEDVFNNYKGELSISEALSVGNFPYSHFGMNAASSCFMKLDISAINIFEAKPNSLGIVESELLLDSYGNFVNSNYENKLENIEKVCFSIVNLVSLNSFGDSLKQFSLSTENYELWTNSKIPLSIVIVLFLFLIIFYLVIKDVLRYKFQSEIVNKNINLLNIEDIISKVSHEVEGKNLSNAEMKQKVSEIIQSAVSDSVRDKTEGNSDDKKDDSNGSNQLKDEK